MISKREAQVGASDMEQKLRDNAPLINWDVTFLYFPDKGVEFLVHGSIIAGGKYLRWQHAESEDILGAMQISLTEWVDMALNMAAHQLSKAIIAWRPEQAVMHV